MEPQKPNNPNFILAIALSLMVLVGWQMFFAPKPQPRNQPSQTTQTGDGNTSQDQSVPSNLTPQLPESLQGNSSDLPLEIIEESETEILARRAKVIANTARIFVENAKIFGSISLQGGHFDDLTLRNYHTDLAENSPNITLFNPRGSANPYHATFNWFGDKTIDFPNDNTLWRVDNPSSLTPNHPITLYWVNNQNVRFEKTFTIDDDYLITVTQRVLNGSSNAITLYPYGLISRTGEPDILNFYILHEGFIGVLQQELIEDDYDDVAKETIIYQNSTGWFGITDKYWLAALIPQSKGFNASFKQGNKKGSSIPTYQADFYAQAANINQGESYEYETLLFAGAKELDVLDQYTKTHNIYKFDLGVDFGILYFITKPIFLLIKYFSSLFGNFGVAILALTVVIKFFFFPLANKSYVSISKMKQLQPQITELKERYGDDKQKLQQEMMRIYREKKINPLAGCIPIVLQIPVFFALYKVLFVTIEMRHAPFFGWIQDLSAPDPLGILTLFGLISWNVPAILTVVNIGIWPILMGLTMWVQQKLNPAPADPMQQKIFALLPFVFTFLLGTFPAGLVIYWTCNNSLTILQQWLITRSLEKKSQ